MSDKELRRKKRRRRSIIAFEMIRLDRTSTEPQMQRKSCRNRNSPLPAKKHQHAFWHRCMLLPGICPSNADYFGRNTVINLFVLEMPPRKSVNGVGVADSVSVGTLTSKKEVMPPALGHVFSPFGRIEQFRRDTSETAASILVLVSLFRSTL
jgi:hypothetical protein